MSSEFNTAFLPKENVPHTFGKQMILVYPDIEPNTEKRYVFMVTKSALEATTIPYGKISKSTLELGNATNELPKMVMRP
jgi:hypothetical protein